MFSGFLSVDAYAYDYEYHLYPVVRNTYYGVSVPTILDLDYKCDVDSSNNYYYKYSATSGTTYDCLMFGSAVDNFYYPFDLERFDYYVVGIFNLTYHDEDIPYSSEFSVDDVYYYDFYDNEYVRNKANADITYFYDNSSSAISYVFPLDNYSMLSIIEYDFLPNLVMTTRVNCQVSTQTSVLAVPKDTSAEGLSAIISAINNQTGTLQGSIGQAADDVQQSIEDQYSGDPETEFSVDDVITQHNEKMGVLSFGSDVMLQFLDMFQSANVGTAQLTLPGFNITVENVEYSVWPDYSFNFEQLNEWVPALMSVIRVMLPAFVWLMVLRYCINVFEKNFLSNGG